MSSIKTYARIKPSLTQFEDVDVVDTDLFLRIPDTVQYYTSLGKGRNKITHQFHFDHVFGEHANQEDVFNTVAVEIVDAFVNGYNGTIFAYGQTGTGKTYTVEGGARRYSERGLASRAVSRIYHSLEEREEEVVSVKVSFLEIYQEVGYDLLSPSSRTGWVITPFPRVSVMEGPGGSCLIRNLSCHLAASEELAQNLLLQGQANRTVAETPVNQRSSRSHAVFTVFLTTKKPNSDVIVRSKLHLVDLAGSERVAKTGVDGQQLSEAKSINLSLHHLESVIIALQSGPGDKKQTRRDRSTDVGVELTSDPHSSSKHVPYRNSLLTMVLRDSLGGNCLTAMIATVSLEWPNLGETISTCRFAQRVACISNCIRRNEEIDDKSLVKILRRKIAELETEISCLKLQTMGTEDQPENMCGKLSEEDKGQCVQIIQDYMAGRLKDPITAGITNPFKFRECLRILKAVVKESFSSVDMPDKSLQRPSCVPSKRPHSTPSSGTSQSIRTKGNALHNQDVETYSECHSRVEMRIRSQSMSNLGRHTEASSIQKCSSLTRTHSVSGTTGECWTGGKSAQKRPQSAHPTTASSKSPYLQKHGRRSRKTGSPGNSRGQQSHSYIDFSNIDLNNSRVVELVRLVENLEGKRALVESQILELKAHMSYLRINDAGEQAVLEARLLEKRLYKRQASVCAKLQRVYQQLSQLSDHRHEDELVDTNTMATFTWHDRFGQHRKADGSLNTRQVFQKLRTEDSVPAKREFTADKGTADSELDLKVEATRQKLSHFKKLLGEKDSVMCEQAGGGLELEGQNQPFSSPTHTSTPSGSRALAGEMDRIGVRQIKPGAGNSLKLEDLMSGGNGSVNPRSEVMNGQDSDGYPAAEDARKSVTEWHPGRHLAELNGSSLYSSVKQPTVDNRELYTPSEYVNQIDQQDVFDAHQMGLYSKTFESALHSMLEKDNAKIFSHKNYNKYARRKHRHNGRDTTTSWDTKGQVADLSPAPEPYRMAQTDLNRTMAKETHPPELSSMNGSQRMNSDWSPYSEYINDDTGVKVKAIPEDEQEFSFLSKAREQKNRIEKIRRAQHSASVIQRAWRRHRLRTANRS